MPTRANSGIFFFQLINRTSEIGLIQSLQFSFSLPVLYFFLRFVEPLLTHLVEGRELKWRTGAIQEFKKLTRNQDLVVTGYSCSDSFLEVDLCYPPNPTTPLQEVINLGDILVFQELAAHSNPKPVVPRLFPFPLTNYTPGEEEYVVVERVFSPEHFFIRSKGVAYKKRSEAISLEIKQIDMRSLVSILAPQVNQPCIYLGTRSDRAVISRVLRERKVSDEYQKLEKRKASNVCIIL